MKKNRKCIILIPTYNDWFSLNKLLKEINKNASKIKREIEILNFLKNREATISQITRNIYLNIDQNLLSVASRNVKAHLIDLIIKKQVTVDDISSDTAIYSLL